MTRWHIHLSFQWRIWFF